MNIEQKYLVNKIQNKINKYTFSIKTVFIIFKN